jgi:hypothetical protein
MLQRCSFLTIVIVLSALVLACESDTGGTTDAGTTEIDSGSGTVENTAPTANAGAAKSLMVDEAVAGVALDGSDSSDLQDGPLTFSWKVIEGTGDKCEATDGTECLTGANSQTPTLTITDATEDDAFTVELTVTDDGALSDTATVLITLAAADSNPPPIAEAGDAEKTCEPSRLLSGFGTDDHTHGAVASLGWVVTQAPGDATCAAGDGTSCLTDSTTGTPTVSFPDGAGDYVITLTVADNGVALGETQADVGTATDTVTITKEVCSACYFALKGYEDTLMCSTMPADFVVPNNYDTKEEFCSNINIGSPFASVDITYESENPCDVSKWEDPVLGECAMADSSILCAEVGPNVDPIEDDCDETVNFTSAWGCLTAGGTFTCY